MRGNEEKYYLISGIGPGRGGVGRLMAHLMARADSRGFRTIFRDDYELLRERLVQRHYFKVVYGLIHQTLFKIIGFLMLVIRLDILKPTYNGYSIVGKKYQISSWLDN